MKKKIFDPAVMNAEKRKDIDFEEGIFFKKYMYYSSTAQFGRNRVLKGQRKTKKK